jgi:hypothetical protein
MGDEMSVAPVRLAAGMAACLLMVPAAVAQEYQTALQVSPEWGARCITVPNGAVAPEQGLQMLACTSSPAQTFAYDPAKMRLSIGGLCVDANGGQPGAVVKLQPCHGGADQIWKLDQKGSFANLVGFSGLCLDIRFGSKESGAALQSWTCEGQPNQLWRFLRK